jgi:hypothetical protein
MQNLFTNTIKLFLVLQKLEFNKYPRDTLYYEFL